MLLVAHYWYPYNNAGAIRWLHFSQEFSDMDVMTTSVPINSTVDHTLPNPNKKTIRFGTKLPAALWGIIASIRLIFTDYTRYIITSPPETLLIGAYVLQLLGRNVFVDMRDPIDRDRQQLKIMVPIYRFCYNRLKKVVVSWKTIDESKTCVYHGYEVEKGSSFKGEYEDRVCHCEYIDRLKKGYIPKQDVHDGYYSSSAHSLIHLGYPTSKNMHAEMYTITPKSYKERAKEMSSVYWKMSRKFNRYW